ncbi:hypothetical protein JXA32_16550 [Candidatus Sumerlaeota bacterium]|nr:hypothetical protein [Candidatus Sumerlaeota bacterium]
MSRKVYLFLFLYLPMSLFSFAANGVILYSNKQVGRNDICGHTSLYYCLKRIGVDAKLRDLLEIAPPVEGMGVSALQLKEMADRYNVRMNTYKNVTIDELKDINLPTILWIKWDEKKNNTANHFVYFDHSISDGKFVVFDGEQRKEISDQELEKSWSHIAITFSRDMPSSKFPFIKYIFIALITIFSAIAFRCVMSLNIGRR